MLRSDMLLVINLSTHDLLIFSHQHRDLRFFESFRQTERWKLQLSAPLLSSLVFVRVRSDNTSQKAGRSELN